MKTVSTKAIRELEAYMDELKAAVVENDGWIWTFPSEEAAMQMQAWLRKQPGCEHADLRKDEHYQWPGKEEP